MDALRVLAEVDVATCDPQRLADLVEAVFDPHQTFTSEITQFFAAINQWQSRYDLSAEELSFFTQVLVRYVTERLDEIERGVATDRPRPRSSRGQGGAHRRAGRPGPRRPGSQRPVSAMP